MNWPAYPLYKDSGVEWLGKVPAGWSVDRLKGSILRSQNGVWGDEPDGGSDDIRCVRVADFDRPHQRIQDLDVTYRKVGASERRGRVLNYGDLILEKSGGGEKNPVGFVVLYDRAEPAVCSNFVARVTLSSDMESRYWTYLHHCLYQSRLTQPSIKQTSGIQNLDQSSYFEQQVCFPPRDDQRSIADFLDRETAKIDALIDKQNQLIATLREDRTATITHAVTKGLNPDAEVKDTGVEWLGEVPRHWSVSRFSRHIAINGGQVDPRMTPYRDMPLIAPNHVESRTGVLIGLESAADQGADSGKYLVDSGQIVYSKIRPNLAKAVIAPCNCLCSADMYALSPDQLRYETAFVLRMLLSKPFTDYVVDSSMRVAMPKVNHDSLGAAPVWIPPIEEQRAIITHLDSECARVDTLITKAAEVIKMLREYRSALITAAVTGKIDVREAA